MTDQSQHPTDGTRLMLDKRINLGLVVVLIVYAITAFITYGQLDNRVNELEKDTTQNRLTIDVLREDAGIDATKLARIEAILERIERRMDRRDENEFRRSFENNVNPTAPKN